MRLLVVEDEQSLRGDRQKLRLSGYEVDACEDGEEALDILASEQYDLILLDLNLPKGGRHDRPAHASPKATLKPAC